VMDGKVVASTGSAASTSSPGGQEVQASPN